jgi:hypothetical protein
MIRFGFIGGHSIRRGIGVAARPRVRTQDRREIALFFAHLRHQVDCFKASFLQAFGTIANR